jgi:hypothetical protein
VLLLRSTYTVEVCIITIDTTASLPFTMAHKSRRILNKSCAPDLGKKKKKKEAHLHSGDFAVHHELTWWPESKGRCVQLYLVLKEVKHFLSLSLSLSLPLSLSSTTPWT